MNQQLANYRVIGVFAEVLSEVMVDLWGDAQEPFVAFDNYIQQLLQEYDIETAEDIQDALKDLFGGTIKEMMEAAMEV